MLKIEQETTSEGFHRISKEFDYSEFDFVSFKIGAEWQQERMYSEEEVFNLCCEFATFVSRKGPSYKKQREWFEQFKKK